MSLQFLAYSIQLQYDVTDNFAGKGKAEIT